MLVYNDKIYSSHHNCYSGHILNMSHSSSTVPTIDEHNSEHEFSKAWKNDTEEKAFRSHVPVKRSIRIGLSRRAHLLPLHPHYPQQ
jgi:hypothetical protein